MSDPATSAECLRAAFGALLEGDTVERDRLCRRAEELQAAETKAAAVAKVLSVDFYVTRAGVAIPTKRMAKAAGVLQ